MKSNPVGWFEIYVNDLPNAKKFYESVFQGSLVQLPNPDPSTFEDLEMWAFPWSTEDSGAAGALVRMAGCPPMTMVYFSCDDCAVEADRVVKAGGKIMRGKTSIGEHGFIAITSDVGGNVIGLHSKK